MIANIRAEDFLHGSEEKLSLPPRSILLTCDDGLRNTLTEMMSILQGLGLSCLFFAAGTSADGTPSMLGYEELYLMSPAAIVPPRPTPAATIAILPVFVSVKRVMMA